MVTYAKVGRELSKIIYDTCQSNDPPRSTSLIPPQRCRLLLPVVQSEALLMAVGSEIVKLNNCSAAKLVLFMNDTGLIQKFKWLKQAYQ